MTIEDLRFTVRDEGSDKQLMLESVIDGKLFEWYERDESGRWLPTGLQAADFQEAMIRAVEEWGEVRIRRRVEPV